MTVRALTVQAGVAGSARVEDVADPEPAAGEVVVETLMVGVCGTDHEIVNGDFGRAPAGRDRFILGHEAVGRVVSESDGGLVVPVVRRPDPVPCPSCAAGEWDMCQNGGYTEHGITGFDGFAVERFAIERDRLVSVPPQLGDLAVLVEPTSIVAKAWEQIERIGSRAHWEPKTALVVGAGPVGLLAALLACQRGFATHVYDIVTDGPKPQLVADLGAEYHTGELTEVCPRADIVVECTGIGSVVLDAIGHNAPNGIVCLAGLSGGTRAIEVDAGALNRGLVLDNDVVFGTVNANLRHYRAAVDALSRADGEWLRRLITRRVPLAGWEQALEHHADDVKVVIEIAK
ncbi:MAG: glucose 1-dehydrogenase [Actinomycetota bacterium]|jgi:threonine dehydrogenase-like Zn-dependent dehydrogenase